MQSPRFESGRRPSARSPYYRIGSQRLEAPLRHGMRGPLECRGPSAGAPSQPPWPTYPPNVASALTPCLLHVWDGSARAPNSCQTTALSGRQLLYSVLMRRVRAEVTEWCWLEECAAFGPPPRQGSYIHAHPCCESICAALVVEWLDEVPAPPTRPLLVCLAVATTPSPGSAWLIRLTTLPTRVSLTCWGATHLLEWRALVGVLLTCSAWQRAPLTSQRSCPPCPPP